MKDGVSIIICCYNSASRIRETLYHLSLQDVETCPSWEIIVVNNNSSDQTSEEVQTAAAKYNLKNLRLIDEPEPGLMKARMSGGNTSALSILSFIDDDNHVEHRWVDKIYSIFKVYPDVSVCGGSSSAKTDAPPPIWFNAFSAAYAVGKQQDRTGYVDPKRAFLWGAGLSVRKEVWDEAMNYRDNFFLTGRKGKSLTAGEDSELCLFWQLKGKKLWYQEDLRFAHYIPDSRLTEGYLINLYSGFGSSEVILRIYRSALNSESILYTHEFRSAAKNYLLLLLKSIVLIRNSSNPIRRMELLSRKRYLSSYLSTLINMRSEYNAIVSLINSIGKK